MAKRIETVLAEVFKARGFRKRARNWFRTTAADEYQIVNLQKSAWGSRSCYLNLGWDAAPAGGFRPESQCAIRFRAEETDVIPPIKRIRPDGVTALELPGISLLDVEVSSGMPDDAFTAELNDVVALPVADLLARTPSIVDLVPLLTAKPWYATRIAHEELSHRGHELPSSW